MTLIDSQVHLWEADRPDRPWPKEQKGKPSFVSVPGARPHRAEPLGGEELIRLMDAQGVDRAVIVPPSPVGDNNATGLEAAARWPDRFAVMGRFDPTAPGAADALTNWRDRPGMLGIRMTFHQPRWAGWLDDPSLDWYWAELERLGIPLMLLAPRLMAPIGRIAARHPRLTLIVDHMGRQSDLRDEACFADLDELLALAAYPGVAVKLSAIPCYSTQAFPFANLTPFLERILESFGAGRVMWGSDLTRLPCSYAECVAHVDAELGFLTAEEHGLLMGGTASKLLHWA